jgi:4-amino-4-deoxy-L-arabinose transferase-like glycosyltransferase
MLEKRTLSPNAVGLVIGAAVALLHLAVVGRYDYFRNELYFIVCGRHPAFGYVDQPPLVPLIAAFTQLAGLHLWLLRLPAAAAAVALVPLTIALARLLGAGRSAAAFAGIAAGFAPGLVALTATLGTSTFEPLAWTAVAYFVTRALVRSDDRAWLFAGICAGIAAEAKYGIAVWCAALAIGLACTPARRVYRMRAAWTGAAIALAIALPSVIWQAAHGWPFFEVIRNSAPGNLTGSPLAFEINEIFALNVLFAPLWIAGIVAPFAVARLHVARPLSIAFGVATIVVIAAHGKNYYLFGAYPAMFAVGAVATQSLAVWLRSVWLGAALLNSLLTLPLVLPVLPPARLAAFLAHAPLRPRPEEVAALGAPLTQLFSDEFGWRALEARVAAIYAQLPPADRARASILAANYGEAAAIDVFGAPDALPPAISTQNQYFLWGPRNSDGSVVIAVGGDVRRWTRWCAQSTVVRFAGSPYAMPYERDRPIVVCRGLPVALTIAWPHLRRYGITTVR